VDEDADQAVAFYDSLGRRALDRLRARLLDRSGFTDSDKREQGAGVTLEIRASRRA